MSMSPQEKARAFADAACHYAEAVAVLCAASDALDQARKLHDQARFALVYEARKYGTLALPHSEMLLDAHQEHLADERAEDERQAREEAGF